MIRWIEGELDGSYVAEPSARKSVRGRLLSPRLYRAVVRDVKLVAAPLDGKEPEVIAAEAPRPRDESAVASGADVSAEAAPADPRPDVPPAVETPPAGGLAMALAPSSVAHPDFRQPRITHVQVPGLSGAGTLYEGPLFDVRVGGVELAFPTDKGGRAYGQMRGKVLGCLVMPEEPPPEPVPATLRVATEPARAGLLHAPTLAGEPTAAEVAGEAAAAPAEADADHALPVPTAAPHPARRPWLSTASVLALVALALGVRCGPVPALLWCVFMLPTVLARALFRGVLRESVGVQVIGAVLAGTSLACAALVAQRWGGDCKDGALALVLVVIAALFPAGLLPARWPLAGCASALAVVLACYCRGPAGHCSEHAPPPQQAAPSS